MREQWTCSQPIRRAGAHADYSSRREGYSSQLVIYVTSLVSRRAIQSSNSSAGIVATVVSRKNGTQPSLSASTPPDDATLVRPTAASEERSAYCVAVNAGEHRSER